MLSPISKVSDVEAVQVVINKSTGRISSRRLDTGNGGWTSWINYGAGGGGGGGTSDHGELEGLADDDHPQYLRNAEADLLYAALSHNHDSDYEAAGAISDHENAADPHSQYLTEDEADLLYAGLAHSHSGLAPSGGSTGQVLKKTSGTDYALTWGADNTGTGAAPIIAGYMPPIGPGGLDFKLGPTFLGTTLGTSSMSSGRLYLSRFIAPADITLMDIGVRVVSAVVASTARLGIYASDADGLPSTLLVDVEIPTDAKAYTTSVINLPVTTGTLYYLAGLFSSNPITSSGASGNGPLGYSYNPVGGLWTIRLDTTYGPLPADLSGSEYLLGNVQSPVIFLDI
jgi:hypothetical protein